MKLRDRVCIGKIGVGVDLNSTRRLSDVNMVDHSLKKGTKKHPLVSTGALRTVINAVNRSYHTPSFPLEP